MPSYAPGVIDKRMSVRGMLRVKSMEHGSGNLIRASECDFASKLYRNFILVV